MSNVIDAVELFRERDYNAYFDLCERCERGEPQPVNWHNVIHVDFDPDAAYIEECNLIDADFDNVMYEDAPDVDVEDYFVEDMYQWLRNE